MVISKIYHSSVMMRRIGIAGLIAAIMGLFFGVALCSWQVVCSFVLGIFLWMLPNGYFANKLFRHLGKIPPASLLKVFYQAEIRKLLLSGFFFVVIIELVPAVNFPVLLVGYFVSQLIFWVQLVMKSYEEQRGLI